MIELFQVTYFTESSLSVGRMLECIEYFFEGYDLVGLFVAGFPDVAVGAGTYFAEDLEFVFDVGLDLLAHEGDEEFILLLIGWNK